MRTRSPGLRSGRGSLLLPAAVLCALLALPLLMGVGLPALPGQPASQPDTAGQAALPDVKSAAQAAAALADKGAALGTPRLYDQPQGLAVDRSDAKNPTVVAFVGPSWVVPTTRPDRGATPAAAAPAAAGLGYVLDRGTGKLLARASEVVPMPKPAVYYIDEWQIATGAFGPTDSIGGQPGFGGGGGGLSIRLDTGGGIMAMMTLQAGAGMGLMNLGAGAARIKFGAGQGKILVRAFGNNNTQIQAVSDDGAYMATCFTQKAGGKLEERFKEILAGLSERPQTTRIWPADSRPRVSGVPGWATPTMGSDAVAMWNPEVRPAGGPGAGMQVYMPANFQVYVAALVLHPYDLPPGLLVDGLGEAKVISAHPAEVADWVGVEKVLQLQAPTQIWPGQMYGMVQPPGAAKQPMTTYQVRLLDLHRDVRRLMIRCQAPKDNFDKYAADFDKILKAIKPPGEPQEPVVVPLEPTTYRPRK